MGATSVTGQGVGIANEEKGPGNGRNYFVPEATPHVVAAGTATLNGTLISVTFPHVLAESKTAYAVAVTPISIIGAGNALYVTKQDMSSLFNSFVIHDVAASSITVDWAVFKSGLGLEIVSGY